MELLTIGRNFYPGRKVLIYYNENENFNTHIDFKERFKLICVEKGNGIVNINGKREILLAPCILCLNEKDEIKLELYNSLKVSSIYFHPAILNEALTFDNLTTCVGLSLTEIQDCAILNPFIIRDEGYNGFLNIDFLEMQRINQLMELINIEINEQNNDLWPCKTRSHLYQFLIQIETLYYKPVSNIDSKVDLKTSDADDIILYLHNNYDKKITILSVTTELHINRNTLRERFYKATGYSIIKYLNKLRVQRATLFLRDKDLLVTEVCEKAGFSDITNFGRIFKKYVGCSPSKYRSQYKV